MTWTPEGVPVPAIGTDDPLYIGVTGHRPQSFRTDDDSIWSLGRVEVMLDFLRTWAGLQGRGVVLMTGMAIGTDQWVASLALRRAFAVHAVLPFVGQESKWRMGERETYRAILSAAWRVTTLQSQEPRSKQQAVSWLYARNTWMADYVGSPGRLSCGIAIWNGEPSGTAHAVTRFRERSVPLLTINPGTHLCEVDPTFPGYQP